MSRGKERFVHKSITISESSPGNNITRCWSLIPVTFERSGRTLRLRGTGGIREKFSPLFARAFSLCCLSCAFRVLALEALGKAAIALCCFDVSTIQEKVALSNAKTKTKISSTDDDERSRNPTPQLWCGSCGEAASRTLASTILSKIAKDSAVWRSTTLIPVMLSSGGGVRFPSPSVLRRKPR